MRTMSDHGEKRSTVKDKCRSKMLALRDCHLKFREPDRAIFCKHINHAFAVCLISTACPSQADAVQTYCSSSGTALKRKQCKEAQISLELCIAAHQTD
eukprot:Gb_11294 [translate_table: standard]